MSIRTTVSRWHGGQLVIAWIGLALLTAILILFCIYLSDSASARQSQEANAYGADATISDEHWNKAIARTVHYSYDDSTEYRKRIEDMAKAIAQTEKGDPIRHQFRWGVAGPMYVAVMIPFLSLFIALYLTWHWFGARSPRSPAS